MVVGNGMIAKAFSKYADDKDVVVFASGVSNSGSKERHDFEREEQLLLQTIAANPQKMLLYFSTCSIYDPSLHESCYVQHKLKMEAFIQQQAVRYIIFRVSNPIGFTKNQHTVLNYFVSHIKQHQFFTVWQYASRNLMDMDDVLKVCEQLMKEVRFHNKIVNVANPVNYPVTTIVEAIENHLGIKGNYDIAEKGNSPLIDTTAIQPLISHLHIAFDSHYLDGLLKKYFPLP
ncbi:MAG: NAD-dependent epimerase/dehydratase family protein [Chitinophagaceae bacterium]|nr:MAG: NAD-dependent epimerase/dehydratase family protein [Chitinophagaceae bacterium]